MNAERLAIAVVGCLLLPVAAQQSLESTYRMTGETVSAAFDAQRAVLQVSSAVLVEGRTEAGYGVVVSDSGHLLAKASEVAKLKNPSVIIDRSKYDGAVVLAVDAEWDVALLKVEASGLKPVVYAPQGEPSQGTWVVANGATSRTKRRALAGIISANAREIPASGGAALGVVLKAGVKRVEIDEINPKSAALEAGLAKGDVILSVDGVAVGKIEDLAAQLKDRKAGSTVKLGIRRGGEELAKEVRLTAKGEMFEDMMSRNDMMSGDFSRRRSGFPRVLQHDILGNSKSVGGPLLDLEGRCVGMNIARATRCESFAIPAAELRALATRLMAQAAEPASGGVAPVPAAP